MRRRDFVTFLGIGGDLAAVGPRAENSGESLGLACFGTQVALRKKGAISRDLSRDYATSDA